MEAWPVLTKLEVDGFKNLHNFKVHFGPFTCIAGPNGVGKSNIFDAILFLANLADKSFYEAVREIREAESIRDLFRVDGNDRMRMSAEMIIPGSGNDEFGQEAVASATFLRYEIALGVTTDSRFGKQERIVLLHEDLNYIKKSEARAHLPFADTKKWIDPLVTTSRTRKFISTDDAGGAPEVRLHADKMLDAQKSKRGGGGYSRFASIDLPRTVLSTAANALDYKTAVLARAEMRSWKMLQLEPSALRSPDSFESARSISDTGEHIPATLHKIACKSSSVGAQEAVYCSVAERLSQLVEGVKSVRVEVDNTHRTLQFMLTDMHGNEYPARSLSDGTLRFVALTVMMQDAFDGGLMCLEEPENGIHPERIRTMLQLLADMAVDETRPVSEQNPLRQIIVNTHSPVVAGQVPIDDLLFARLMYIPGADANSSSVVLACMPETWRAALDDSSTISLGSVISYLRGGDLSPSSGIVTTGRYLSAKQLKIPFMYSDD